MTSQRRLIFFREIGLELEGRATIEGEWAGRVTGLGDQRVEIAMMRTPDGHGRLELEKPLHDPSRELASGFGFAFGRAFTRKVAAMIELRTESSIDFQRDRLVLVNAGIIDGVRNVVVYANIGHSVFSDDGEHFYAGGGFKVVIGR